MKVGKRFVIKGRVLPRAPRAKVKLQRRTVVAGWVTVERDRLSRSSRYRFDRTAHSAGDKRFRVVKISKHKRVAVRSAVRQIRMVDSRIGRTGAARTSSPAAPNDGAVDVLTDREAAVLRLTNELRAKGVSCGGDWYGPAPALRANPKLTTAARDHAADMAAHDYFDHTGRDGSQPWDRAADAGYDGRRIGENIAWGQQTAADVVRAWRESPGHCRNLMNPAYDDLGVGAVGSGSPLWVQLFGA